jgi:hypothetical protein
MSERPIRRADLDPNGKFVLEVEKPGPYVIKFQNAQEIRIFVRVNLVVGSNSWETHLPCGSLIVNGAKPLGEDGTVSCYRWQGIPGVTTFLWVASDASGECRYDDVPAGMGQIVSRSTDGMAFLDNEWTVGQEVHITERETPSIVLGAGK